MLVEDVRIGSIDGDERYILGEVSGVAVTADGDIWVADQAAAHVRRYSPQGEHLGDVGRRGEGPGEFDRPLQVRWDARDETMLVWDPLNSRLHRFSAEGDLVDSYPLELAGHLSVYGLPQMQLDTAGRTYGLDRDRGPRSGRSRGVMWTVRDPEGRVVDTLRAPAPDSEGIIHPIRSSTAPSPLGYLVSGRNDEIALSRPRAEGGFLRIERSAEPVAYAAAERRKVQRLQDHFAGRRSQSPARVPADKPLWSSFFIDAEGRIWLSRYGPGADVGETEAEVETRERYSNPPRTWGHSVAFDVITDAGAFMGTIRFPEVIQKQVPHAVELLHAQGRRLWTLERGSFDEQYVVQYRIEGG